MYCIPKIFIPKFPKVSICDFIIIYLFLKILSHLKSKFEREVFLLIKLYAY